MARTNNLTDFLTDVAGAIKEKKGTSSPIPASEFDTEIASIRTGGNYQDKTITLVDNGNYTLNPDEGYDAITSVDINVNVPTGSGDVKLFETTEEMQNDSDAQIGDLAVVYGTKLSNITANTVFSSCVFPSEVVLEKAFTDNIYGSFRSVNDSDSYFDGMIDLSSSSFRFNGYGENEEINVTYTSSNGITYTRTDDGEEEIRFGVSIQYNIYGDEFNSVIGKFMIANVKNFNGLYEYTAHQSTDRIQLLDFSTSTIKMKDDGLVSSVTIGGLLPQEYSLPIIREIMTNNGFETGAIYLSTNNQLKFISKQITSVLVDSSGLLAGLFMGATSYTSVTIYDLDLVNKTISNPVVYDGKISYTSKNVDYLYIAVTDMKSWPMSLYPTLNYKSINTYTYSLGHWQSTLTYGSDCIAYENRYIYANTQLTLNNANRLYPDVTAYGSNGIITGDGSIWSSLQINDMLSILRMPDKSNAAKGYLSGVNGEANNKIQYLRQTQFNTTNLTNNVPTCSIVKYFYETWGKTRLFGWDNSYIYAGTLNTTGTALSLYTIEKATDTKSAPITIILPQTILTNGFIAHVFNNILYIVGMTTDTMYLFSYNLTTEVISTLDTQVLSTTASDNTFNRGYVDMINNVLYYGIYYLTTSESNNFCIIMKKIDNGTITSLGSGTTSSRSYRGLKLGNYFLLQPATTSWGYIIYNITTGASQTQSVVQYSQYIVTSYNDECRKFDNTHYIVSCSYYSTPEVVAITLLDNITGEVSQRILSGLPTSGWVYGLIPTAMADSHTILLQNGFVIYVYDLDTSQYYRIGIYETSLTDAFDVIFTNKGLSIRGGYYLTKLETYPTELVDSPNYDMKDVKCMGYRTGDNFYTVINNFEL